MENKLASSVLICVMCCGILPAQQITLRQLAGLVAGENTRQEAISFVSDSPRARIPLLMELTAESFPDIDNYSLQIGLAEIFGELKVEESVPFLVNHLILRWSGADFAPWLKTEPVVLRSFPCIQALVLIGPNASRAVIREYAGRTDSEERLAAIFVVAQIPNVPEAVEFLKSVSSPTVLERYYIDKGLRLQAS